MPCWLVGWSLWRPGCISQDIHHFISRHNHPLNISCMWMKLLITYGNRSIWTYCWIFKCFGERVFQWTVAMYWFFLRIWCFLMRCLWVNLIFQMSILLTSSCWKKGSHWDDRGKRRKNKEKRFKRLKKVHQRRKFVPFVNFLSFFESPSSINITNVNWIMYCWSLHPIWKCTCQLESYWI